MTVPGSEAPPESDAPRDSQAPPQPNPRVARRRHDGVVGFVVESVAMGWRWLVRMRTALILLGVLAGMTAVATAVPQYPNVPGTVEAWLAGDEGPGTGIAEALRVVGAYDVYGSPAFLALLLALYLSLTACLIPRVRAWVRLVRRSRPPLLRHRPTGLRTAALYTREPADEVLTRVEHHLRGRRWRTRRADGPGEVPQIAAEKGLWTREGGSLLFHLSFYVLLAAVVFGQMLTFEGQRGVIEGEPGFADTEVSYWTYRPGRWFTGEDHAGWRLDLDRFHVDWVRDPQAAGAGQATHFRSEVTITPAEGASFAAEVEGNRPLVVDGMKIHQLDWGYAPWIEIEADGQLVHAAFLTTVAGDDGIFRGAAKAPAAHPDVGLEIELFPFAPDGPDGLPRLTGAPWDEAPLIVYHQWRGDLQLGRTQQIITELDTDLLDPSGWGFLRPGQEVVLDGVTVRFVELRRWVGFQVSTRPQVPWLLFGSSLLVLGLIAALYAFRRRLWVCVEPDPPGGRTLVEVSGRAFQRPEVFEDEHTGLVRDLAALLDATATDRSEGT
jgi:cytochrome c biogenesis protein